MGEVYRARDARLHRNVALKVLNAEVAGNVGRLARFEQEARAAAALNHPNILGIHDIGSDQGVTYIATELVIGETLAVGIRAGPVPLRRLLDIAVQVAAGLACAHTSGIVHRDLKPENVMVTKDGAVKILDFGLAKQTVGSAAASVTAMGYLTDVGTILGTINYMSPEQARGQPADHRSDQFSLGIVLYEMAAGRLPFDKASAAETLSAIIAEEPLPIDNRTPPPLRWTIDRCLAKDPNGRYESTHDLAAELRGLREHLSEPSLTRPPASGRPAHALRRKAAWCLAATVVGAAAVTGGMFFGARSRPPDQSDYRYTPFSFEAGGQGAPVWSPDGLAVAYAARPVLFGPMQIFVRYLNAASPLQLTHGKQSAFPVAWSPDNARVLVAVLREPFGISTVSTAGGDPELLTSLPDVWRDEQNVDSGRIAVSPDNKVVATMHADASGAESVWITSLADGRTIRYGPEPFASKDMIDAPMLRFSPDGRHLLLMLNGGHGDEAWLLDYPGGGTAGARRVFADSHGFGGTPEFSWMPDSRHIVMSYQPASDARVGLWLVDTETGSRRALTSGTAHTTGAAVSPEGTRLILTENRDEYDVVSVDLATGAAARLIATERSEQGPSWAAAAPALAYVTDRNGTHEIWLHEANTIDRPVVVAADFPAGTTEWLMGPALSPDSTRVVYARIEAGSAFCKLWMSGVAGGTPIRLTNDNSIEYPGSWSRDGAWFVYQRQGGGRIDLMKVKATGGQATPILVKADTKVESVPSWSPAGTWFVVGDRLISLDGQTEKRLGTRHSPSYVFSADGRSVYGIESNREHDLLFRIDVATNAETVVGDVGREFRPASDVSPEIRFSLAQDGKTFVYSSLRHKQNLWMLRGFAPRTGILARLGL